MLKDGRLFAVVVALVVAAGIGYAAVAPEALSELEQTKLELLRVRTAYAQLVAQHDACKAEVGSLYNALGALRASAATSELTAQEAKLKADIERAHDGYTFDPKTGTLTKKK